MNRESSMSFGAFRAIIRKMANNMGCAGPGIRQS